MEPIPSVELLDIHCPQGTVHKQEIQDISVKVRSAFGEIVELAKQAGSLRLEVENEQEGLEATKAAYLNLVGDEKTAKSLGDLGRFEAWHRAMEQGVDTWRSAFQIPPGPKLPSAPRVETDLPIADYVPSDAIPGALAAYRTTVLRAADELVETLRTASASRYPRVESLRGDIQASLGGDQHATPELAAEAERYRARLSTLEQQATDLAALDKRIDEGLQAADSLIDQASRSWADLRRARQAACTAVNKSMPSFFVRLNPNSLTEDIDQLLSDLRTGTYLHEASMQETREALDRKSFVRAAIGHLQFPASDNDQGESSEASVNARKIAHTSVDREKFDGIAQLAALWPSDGIEILLKRKGDDPVPFESLTKVSRRLLSRKSHSPRHSFRP